MVKDIAIGISFTIGTFVLAYAMAEPNAVSPAYTAFGPGSRAGKIVGGALSLPPGEKTSLRSVASKRKEAPTQPKPRTAPPVPNVRTSKTMCDPTFPLRGSIAHPACF